jgi:integrase/recombinase XerD
MSTSIQYALITHDGRKRISIRFEYSAALNKRMQQVPDAQWSKTLKCWHIPDTVLNRQRCGLPPAYLKTKNGNENAFSIDHILATVYEKIQLKGYSQNTCRNYCIHLREYFSIISGKYAIEAVEQPVIEKYLLWRMQQKQCSESDMNSHINAIKFYYEQVLG